MEFKSIKKYIIWLGPLLFILTTVKKLHLAQQFAELSNLNISQAISLWASEKEMHSAFTSTESGAILRIDRTIYSFIICCLWSFFSYRSIN